MATSPLFRALVACSLAKISVASAADVPPFERSQVGVAAGALDAADERKGGAALSGPGLMRSEMRPGLDLEEAHDPAALLAMDADHPGRHHKKHPQHPGHRSSAVELGDESKHEEQQARDPAALVAMGSDHPKHHENGNPHDHPHDQHSRHPHHPRHHRASAFEFGDEINHEEHKAHGSVALAALSGAKRRRSSALQLEDGRGAQNPFVEPPPGMLQPKLHIPPIPQLADSTTATGTTTGPDYDGASYDYDDDSDDSDSDDEGYDYDHDGDYDDEEPARYHVSDEHDRRGGCVDQNFGAVDSEGFECDYYEENPAECGRFDDNDFIAENMCCACLGDYDDEDHARYRVRDDDDDDDAGHGRRYGRMHSRGRFAKSAATDDDDDDNKGRAQGSGAMRQGAPWSRAALVVAVVAALPGAVLVRAGSV